MIQIQADGIVQIAWFLKSSVCLFMAIYTWLVWWQVRGIRGLAIAVMLTSLTLISASSGMLHSPDAHIPQVWLLAISRSAWWPLVLSALVLADIWSADHNDHRSLTTITYLWFKWLASTDRERTKRNRYKVGQEAL